MCRSIPAFAVNNGAGVYIACTVNSFNGVDKDLNHLAAIAAQYHIPVLMSNCIGITGEYNCAGKTSAWDENGGLLLQMDDKHEGLLILDTVTMKTQEYLAINLINEQEYFYYTTAAGNGMGYHHHWRWRWV